MWPLHAGSRPASGEAFRPHMPNRDTRFSPEHTSPETSEIDLFPSALHLSSESAEPSDDLEQPRAPRPAPHPSPVHPPDIRPWDVARVAGAFAVERPEGCEASLAEATWWPPRAEKISSAPAAGRLAHRWARFDARHRGAKTCSIHARKQIRRYNHATVALCPHHSGTSRAAQHPPPVSAPSTSSLDCLTA
jgi:hypothetical protein